MKSKIIIILITINLLCIMLCKADKRIVYNDQRKWYEIWHSERDRLVSIVYSDIIHEHNAKRNISFFPYQEGWPVLESHAVVTELNIYDLNNDTKKEIAFMDCFNGRMNLYSYLGYPLESWNPPIMSYVATFEDIDYDGVYEVIATEAGGGYLFGAGVRRIDSSMLSGFPNPPDTAFNAASVADIDRDGNYEILFAPHEKSQPNDYHLGLYAISSWGGMIPGFPVIFPFDIPFVDMPANSGTNWASPSVGDFDEDGLLEISATSLNGRFYLIKADGNHFRNWPIVVSGSSFEHNPPVIGDVDNDSHLEVATADNSYGKIYLFREDALFEAGFPAKINQGQAYQSPVFADVDEDGYLEFFAYHVLGKLCAFDHNGVSLPGWSIEVADDIGQYICFNNAPTLGDIDGDGEIEVVAAGLTCEWCSDGVLVAYNLDGTMVPGFPIIVPQYNFNANPALTDLDNDGDIEICTPSEFCDHSEKPSYVFCWDLPYAYNKEKIAWENYAHDSQHTGRYVNPAVEPPVVQRINPNVGFYKGGTVVEIKGKNFLQGSKVFLDGIPAQDVRVVDSNTIYAITPPHKPCFFYINDISISPYELSLSLVNQLATDNLRTDVFSSKVQEEPEHRSLAIEQSLECIVKVVVVHPSPD